MSDRYLIVNADDFGQSPGINRGIIQAHENGIVTSASMMVRWPAARVAAEYSRRRPELSVGLHLDLGEWDFRNGGWHPRYEVVSVDDALAVGDELLRQIELFRSLVGSDPTHIDSHQHVHSREPARSVVNEIVKRVGVPLRHDSAVRYCGSFYGQTSEGEPLPQAIQFDSLIRVFRGLGPGTTELGCHPGLGEDTHTMYSAERRREVEVLCDARLRSIVDGLGITLCNFRDFDGYQPAVRR